MSKLSQLFFSMFKIGLIGFGGGNALIPVIEKTAVDEQKLITKSDYDTDVMIASITPGALPVEIAGGIGRRIFGAKGLLLGAAAMALPGVVLTIVLSSLISTVNDSVLNQISFLTIGIYAFICCLLIDYIHGTVKNFRKDSSLKSCVAVIAAVILLICGKNVFRLLPIGASSVLSLSTIHIFAMAFFIIAFTGCRLNVKNSCVSLIMCILFILCNCKANIINNDLVKYTVYIFMIVLGSYGIKRDHNKKNSINTSADLKTDFKAILICIVFMVASSIPGMFISENIFQFMGKGFLSSIMSFGGGDAYLTVADGMFVQSGMVTENEFYSSIVPLVNILPGSILCKTLSGVGYYIGLDSGGSVIGGILVALCGFATSVAASCSVFGLVAALYDKLMSLNVFILIKKWIKPIVSGLLVNVMLSLLVQINKVGTNFGNTLISFICFSLIFAADIILYNKTKVKNEVLVLFSTAVSIVFCNVFYNI